jgi:hypothetical protein
MGHLQVQRWRYCWGAEVQNYCKYIKRVIQVPQMSALKLFALSCMSTLSNALHVSQNLCDCLGSKFKIT